MNKYLLVAKNTWIETFTYRLNFVVWRVRVSMELLTRYFLWLAIIPTNTTFLSYNQSQMLTYVLVTSFVEAIVLSTRTHDIADKINSGSLSNFLITPVNIFSYWFSRDLGDKLMNISFMTVELALFFIIFHPPFFIQTNLILLSIFILSILLATIMHFYIGFSLSLIGFWSPETWAPRFIFFIVVTFFSGWTFPLDILPSSIYEALKYFPFTYLIYFPVKVYLGTLNNLEILMGIIICSIWIVIIYFFTKAFWKIGLKSYTAAGK